ncbi:hypothetical protein Mp_4g01830 [Marchantia polymorpha subsp. ruderalis]|uniref:Uncharacterized protein n=2 Tax=Marchantia polymorpha TaxID=3197 RepID=A0AAF6B5B3_MARPO|nr:hypothetical protein MARPO_0098s0017 [Marchantia polymorpha]BBN07197.1 hypothetical protein Mp_4g01830 [Marchantia polymorpha subsp. ruderalis]|eukprot:PTQ32462.1 hypothetical protein MARPO_0098s0017 [Marchantia polymorpha]
MPTPNCAKIPSRVRRIGIGELLLDCSHKITPPKKKRNRKPRPLNPDSELTSDLGGEWFRSGIKRERERERERKRKRSRDESSRMIPGENGWR